MGGNNTTGKKIKSTQTAFDIIESIAERDRPTVSEIAEDVDHSRSTVHYHLQTFQENRYVIRDEDGFRLGLKMSHLGTLALRNHRLSGIVEKPANDLATDIGAVAHVAVKERNSLVWLYRSENPSIDDLSTDVGTHVPLHSTAYGQAILAHLPEETVELVVTQRGLPASTEQTLTDTNSLEDRLRTVRQLGFAYSAEECEEGLASIACPIVSEGDEVVGAIGVTDSNNRIEDPYKHTKARRFSDELPSKVKDTARVVGEHVDESS